MDILLILYIYAIRSLTLGFTKARFGRTRLLKDEALYWTILGNPRIPLTNNAAERDLDPLFVYLPLSGNY